MVNVRLNHVNNNILPLIKDIFDIDYYMRKLTLYILKSFMPLTQNMSTLHFSIPSQDYCAL